LPLFPGAHAVRDALAAGATKTGTTIHWVDAGVDTGEVIAQAELDIAPGDSEESLHERIKILERSLIVATIEQLLSTMENGRS
jgi:phosphoribosylglycinamide formyltransferase-1